MGKLSPVCVVSLCCPGGDCALQYKSLVCEKSFSDWVGGNNVLDGHARTYIVLVFIFWLVCQCTLLPWIDLMNPHGSYSWLRAHRVKWHCTVSVHVVVTVASVCCHTYSIYTIKLKALRTFEKYSILYIEYNLYIHIYIYAVTYTWHA